MRETESDKRARLLARTRWSVSETAFMLRRGKATISDWLKEGLAAVPVTINGTVQKMILADDARAWASNPHRRTRRRHQA